MEKLDRSVIAQRVSGGVYVNWRITSDEWYNTSYRLYRDGTLIYESGVSGASNYLDVSGTTTSVYTVIAVKNDVLSAPSAATSVITTGYIDIPMRNIKTLGKTGYFLNDCTAADLDGDGQMEIIVKRLNTDWSTTNTNYTFFEAYKLDGTFLWAIDVGPNITMDVEINIAAFDFDGDGKAEVFMRTSDNTVFGDGTSVGDRDGDGVTNYRYSIGGDGFMNAGPEYLSLIDGETGAELDWVNFIARGSSSDWGDDYGHRANKFFFGAPYLDGVKPSLFIGRGIYTQTKMATYDVVNKQLVARWTYTSSGDYSYQGNHNYTIADTDGDGCDEIVWGSMCVDHTGTGLYTTALGHGDAMHVGDFDPYYKGIEVFACNEANPGTNLRDGATGKILMRHITSGDCGRCGAGNISDDFKGAEIWGGSIGASATDREKITHFGVAENYSVYWDGDLLQEICDHTGFSTSTGVGYGQITKFNGYGNISTLLTASAYSCNYTKGTPCLQADLVGDWREEEIWWRTDSLALRMYITPYQTEHRIYSLLHDHQYRQAVCWQMCGYNQPPHTSFYLGSDFPTPIPAKSTNGKLVLNGATAVWDTTSLNWMEGDSAAALLAGTSTLIPYTDGRQVLLDTRGTNKTLTLAGTLKPELLMVSGTADYTLQGTGILSGSMRLDKLGSGTLTMDGSNDYSGTTDIWEGDVVMNGTLLASPVVVRRHATYGGTGITGNGISTEYNASINMGNIYTADTMRIMGTVKLAEGAKFIFDLSDEPTIPEDTSLILTGKANDYLKLTGTLEVSSKSIFNINKLNNKLVAGDYLLGQVDSVTGDISTVKIGGVLGTVAYLVYDTVPGLLYLRIKGVRNATAVEWSGNYDGVWDLSNTSNWLNEGLEDFYVPNDSVYFTSSGLNRAITLTDSIPVAYMNINSGLDYTFNGTGVLTGPMKLDISGGCKVTINNRNAFTGITTIDNSTIVMKYAPSSTANGGIGINNTSISSFVLKDSAIMNVSTANEITSRGVTMSGTNGGLMNVTGALYWDGLISGTKLTKTGSAVLYLTSNNYNLNETVLRAGTIKLNASSAVPYGIGKKITIYSGTLETYNANGDYLTSSHAIELPSGYTGTFIAAPRCEYNGALTGGGTLNWYCDFIRAYMNGNWSAFTGTLNIIANSANSSYENHFIVNNSAGFSNASISLGSGVVMCYKNGTSDNGTTTIKVGLLTGVSGSTFYNAGLEVGSNNKSGYFSGSITGATSIKKVGTGIWYLTGTNSYTGSTTISAGTVTISGTKSGSGSISVASGAALKALGSVSGTVLAAAGSLVYVTGTLGGPLTLSAMNETSVGARLVGNGKITGSVTARDYSFISPSDSLAIGTLSIGGNLTMGESFYEVQLSGGVTAKSDKLAVTGTLSLGGFLEVKRLNETPLIAGHSIQVFSAGTITGSFTSITLPELDEGLAWDTTALYETGVISIYSIVSLNKTTIRSGLVKNPTDGLFQVRLSNPAEKITMSVINLSGKLVYRAEVSAEDYVTIDLRQQCNGLYLLKMVAEDKTYGVLKLIKE